MVFLPHTNTVILLELYCGTITEPGLPVVIAINSYLKNEACKSAKLQIICSRWLRSIRPGSVSYNLHCINTSTVFEVSNILTFKLGLPIIAPGIFWFSLIGSHSSLRDCSMSEISKAINPVDNPGLWDIFSPSEDNCFLFLPDCSNLFCCCCCCFCPYFSKQ